MRPPINDVPPRLPFLSTYSSTVSCFTSVSTPAGLTEEDFRFQKKLFGRRVCFLSVPRIKSIFTPVPFNEFKLSLQPSCSAPARNANVEYLLLPPRCLAALTQFGVQLLPRLAGSPTKLRFENVSINFPSFLNA